MRYLVTGAAGFIGSQLLQTLLERGHDAVGWDAFTDYYDPSLKEENARDLPVTRVDLAEDALALGGFDGVFHLAGQPGVASFGGIFPVYVRQNVLASQRLFEEAVAARVRVVVASSSSVYGDAETYPTPEDVVPRPISPYGITKLSCEHLAYAHARAAGLDAVGLRYFTVYGPRQRPDMAFTRMLETLAEGSAFHLYGDGSASRSFTYVDDAVSGTIAAMERGESGSIYNIGGGEEASMSDVFALVQEISGRTLRIERDEAAAGDVRRTSADCTRASEHLGWAASTPLADGLAQHWSWVVDRVGVQ